MNSITCCSAKQNVKKGFGNVGKVQGIDVGLQICLDVGCAHPIGARRQDEIGTPYCFTIDDETVSDGTVTVRERNTMAQERIALDKVADYLREKIKL